MENRNHIEGGFILLSRKMEDENSSFMHCKNNDQRWMFIMSLLRANYKDNIWNGISIKRGQFVTSRERFAREAHTSERKVRTFWNIFAKVGFLTTKTTNKYTLVTICSYDRYQDLKNYFDEKRPAERPSKDHQKTTNKECKGMINNSDKDFEETFGINPNKVIKKVDDHIAKTYFEKSEDEECVR